MPPPLASKIAPQMKTVPTSGNKPKRDRRKKFQRYTKVFCRPISKTLRYFSSLINLDICLFPEAIDPLPGRLLALSLLQLLLNSVTNFGERDKAGGLLGFTIEDIKRISDLNHLTYLTWRKIKRHVRQLLIQCLTVDESPVAARLSCTIHRVCLGHRCEIGATLDLFTDLVRHFPGGIRRIGIERVGIQNDHAKLQLLGRNKFLLICFVVSLNFLRSGGKIPFDVVLAHRPNDHFVPLGLTKLVQRVALSVQCS